MSNVTLSSAVRSNLLNLQNTASMMAKTQERLATGMKVNSALDNPTNFFTASSLNSRASDLGHLMDSVGNAIQTIAAADKGIQAITKLVESAQSTARQALQAAAPSFTLTGTESIAADDRAAVTGDTALDDTMDGEAITINGSTFTYIDDPEDITNANTQFSSVSELENLLRANNINATASLEGTNLKLTATRDTGTLTVSGALAENTGLIADAGEAETFRATNTDLAALVDADHSISITSDGRTETLTFGEGAIENRADLVAALNDLKGVNAKLVDGKVEITTKGGNPFEISASNDAVNTALGLVDGDYEASEGNSKRSELVQQYNDLLEQINQLAKDASFNGVNLLDGDDLQVIFNEDGTSSLTVQGVTNDAQGLGLFEITDDQAWNTNVGINDTLDGLKDAIEQLRIDASKFGSNLSVVENRQDFTKNMINVLQTGAANLTLADTNEEAANLLALQTRQQLSSTALSMASQADQSVLRLF